MKRLCSALLVLAMAGCSGVDVQGIVRDERTGEPLPGAKVMIGDEETATDYRGFFELEVDEDEASEMRVNKSGYSTYSESVSFEEDMDEVIQDVELAPASSMGTEGSIEGTPGSLEGTEGTLPPAGSNEGLDTEGVEEDGSRGTQPGTYRGAEQSPSHPDATQPPAGWTPKKNWEPMEDDVPGDGRDGTMPVPPPPPPR
jgi:hypothetical protein